MIVLPESPSPEDVGNYYDRFDNHYRTLWGTHLHHGYWTPSTATPEAATTNLLDLCAQWLNPTPQKTLIDVGCGYGESGRYLNAKFGCSVTGFTVARKQFELGTSLSQSTNTRIELADWVSWKGTPTKADGILSLECLCHVANKGQFFQKIAQTLKPESRAVITFLAATERGSHHFQGTILAPLCHGAKFPSLTELKDLEPWLKAAKLRIVESQDLTSAVQRTWRIISGRALQKLSVFPSENRDTIKIGRKEIALSLNALRLQMGYWIGAVQYRFLVVESTQE